MTSVTKNPSVLQKTKKWITATMFHILFFKKELNDLAKKVFLLKAFLNEKY